MEIAICTLNEQEVKEQEQTIRKFRNLMEMEMEMGGLMDLDNVLAYAKTIKEAHNLIENGMIFDNPFMVDQLKGQPNVIVVQQ